MKKNTTLVLGGYNEDIPRREGKKIQSECVTRAIMLQGIATCNTKVLIKIFDYSTDCLTSKIGVMGDEHITTLCKSLARTLNKTHNRIDLFIRWNPWNRDKKTLVETYLYPLYHVYRHSDKCKIQVDKASGNWRILRERNEFNGLHLLKLSWSNDTKRQIKHEITTHAKYRIKWLFNQ